MYVCVCACVMPCVYTSYFDTAFIQSWNLVLSVAPGILSTNTRSHTLCENSDKG